MKKLLLFAVLLIPISTNAQNWRLPQNYFGIKAGLYATKVSTDTVDIERAFTPYFGLTFDHRFDFLQSKKNELRLNISGLYSIRGSNVTSPFYKYRYQQFELPVGLSYSLGGIIRLNAGLNQAFNLSSIVFQSDRSDFDDLGLKTFHPSTEAFLGFDLSLKVAPDIRTDLNFRYLIPVTDNEFSSYRFGFSYYFSENKIKSFTEAEVDPAFLQVIEIKENVILVRLQDSKTRIKSFEDNGLFKKAEELRSYQDSVNKSIYKAFADTFNFTKVLFFFSSDTRKVLNGEFDGVFLNETLEKDESIKMNYSKFYITEFAYLSSGGRKSMEGLILKDKELLELERPFPYFIKRNEVLLTKDNKTMVAELNRKLHDFYRVAKQELIINGSKSITPSF